MDTKKSSDLLKLIAIVAMVIDHAGYALFGNAEWMRIIGRITFPIFAYQLVQGYLFTSNSKKYMIRLWVFALIAQVPFTLLFDTYTLNVLFTLFLSLVLIDGVHRKEYTYIPIILLASFFIPMDYEWYGVLLPLIFYLTQKSPWLALFTASVWTVFFVFMTDLWMIQLFAIIGLAIALFFPKKWGFNISFPRYFFYWFYPVHMCILFVLQWTVFYP